MRSSLVVLATGLVGLAAAAPVVQTDVYKGTQKVESEHKRVPSVTSGSECMHHCNLEYGNGHIGVYGLIACEKKC